VVRISERLTALAEIEKNLSDLTVVSNASPVKAVAVIEGELKRHSEKSSTNQYYGSQEYSTAILAEDTIKSAKDQSAQLRKQKIALNDEILSLNIKTEILLDSASVDLLKGYNLI
jgi:hypothetical protein